MCVSVSLFLFLSDSVDSVRCFETLVETGGRLVLFTLFGPLLKASIGTLKQRERTDQTSNTHAIRSFIRSFVRSFVHSFNWPPASLFVRSLAFTNSLVLLLVFSVHSWPALSFSPSLPLAFTHTHTHTRCLHSSCRSHKLRPDNDTHTNTHTQASSRLRGSSSSSGGATASALQNQRSVVCLWRRPLFGSQCLLLHSRLSALCALNQSVCKQAKLHRKPNELNQQQPLCLFFPHCAQTNTERAAKRRSSW